MSISKWMLKARYGNRLWLTCVRESLLSDWL